MNNSKSTRSSSFSTSLQDPLIDLESNNIELNSNSNKTLPNKTPQDLLTESYKDLERIENIKQNILANISILEKQIQRITSND